MEIQMDSHPLIELRHPSSSWAGDATESGNEPQLFMCSDLYLAVCEGRKKKVMELLVRDNKVAKLLLINPLVNGIKHGHCDIHEVSPEGNNLLHLAAEQGHDDLIREIYHRFRDNKDLLSSRNSTLNTPLHCAATAGHDRTVSLLIQLAREILGGKNEAGDTALHLAARHGHGAAVAALVSAAPELASEVNGAGVSPLYLAVISSSADTVRAITTKCRDASAVGPSSQNALHAAVFHGLVDDSSSSPLHFASSDGDRSVVSAILSAAAPSTVYKQDSEGLSALHVAARMGHVGVAVALMKACPEAVELRDRHGGTFLHCAARRGDAEVVSLAIKDTKLGRLLGAQDRDGNTPLHLAVEAGASGVVQALMSKGKVRADVMNNDGCTPYDLVAKSNSFFKVIGLVVTLTTFGARSRPQRQDHVQQWSGMGQGIDEKTSDTLALIATVIAAVAFGAAFNVPGSYEDDGMTFFKCFLVLDSVALAASVLAVILLVYGKASRCAGSWKSLAAALHCLWVSLISMMLAFYAALASLTCTRAVTYLAIDLQLFFVLVLLITEWTAPAGASFRTSCKFLWEGSRDAIRRRTRRQYPIVRAFLPNLLLFTLINFSAFAGLLYISSVARNSATGCRAPPLMPASAPSPF